MNERDLFWRKKQQEYFNGPEGELDLKKRQEALAEQEQLLATLEASLKNVSNEEHESHLKKAILGVKRSIQAEKTGIALVKKSKADLNNPIEDSPSVKIAEQKSDDQSVSEIVSDEDQVGDLSEADSSWAKEHIAERGVFDEVSSMDWEALNSQREEGRIQPPVRRGFITSVKLPLPNGYIQMTHQSKDAEELPAIADYPEGKEDIQVSVQLGKETGGPLPIPYGAKPVAGGEEGLYVQPPTNDAPLVWVNQDYVEDGKAEYILAPEDEQVFEGLTAVIPDDKEMAYWEKVMPLPQEVKKKAFANPKLAENIIASYIRKKFVYVCHDALGEFIKENADDLPLIMDELKMGHCDLLSWAHVAYLRQLGLPAFAISERVPNMGGDAFMADYGHTRIAIVQEDGTLAFQDPTILTEKAESYTPKHLPKEIIDQLNLDYNNQETETGKRNVLRTFLEDNPIDKEVPVDEIRMDELFGFLGGAGNMLDLINSIKLEREARLPKEVLVFDHIDLSQDLIFAEALTLSATLHDVLGYRGEEKEIPYVKRVAMQKAVDFFASNKIKLTTTQVDGNWTHVPSGSVFTGDNDVHQYDDLIGHGGNFYSFFQKEFEDFYRGDSGALKKYETAISEYQKLNFFPLPVTHESHTLGWGESTVSDINLELVAKIYESTPRLYSFSDESVRYWTDVTKKDRDLEEMFDSRSRKEILAIAKDIPFFLQLFVLSFEDEDLHDRLQAAFPDVDFRRVTKMILGIENNFPCAPKQMEKKCYL